MAKKNLNISDHVFPLYMDGLVGRMLYLPPPKNSRKEILLLYGHHASIERMAGLAMDLNKYGAITMPDLPGFGGMESFYKLGEKPSLDNLADYLAAFVKMRYKRRRVSILAMSFGFVVATRMLQRYPELAKKVDLTVSIVGFAHNEDFRFSRKNIFMTRLVAWLLSFRLTSWLVRHIGLRGMWIKIAYKLVENRHVKLKDADRVERKKRVDFEVILWQCNDVRTYMHTTVEMLKLNLCNSTIDLPLHHVAVPNDRYFDNERVEQHLKVIYKEVEMHTTDIPGHAPTVVASAKEAAPFVPPRIRKLLRG